jgi:hypothetical protein
MVIMKMKLLSVLLVSALVLTFSGTSQAVTFHQGPGIFKTWNNEIGTTYFGGEAGKLYFIDDSTTVYTEEYGGISKGAGDGLISDLGIVRPDGLEAGEDSYGIFNITSIWDGDILPTDSRFGDGSDASDLGNNINSAAGGLYWYEGIDTGDGAEYLRGMFYGAEDVLVECIVPNKEYKIWSVDGEFDVYEILDDAAYNPAIEAGYDPTARTGTDEFPDWFDKAADELIMAGSIDYQRFQTDTLVDPNQILFDGQTEVLLSVTDGSLITTLTWFEDWWQGPDVDQGMSDIWQTWNIGDPYVLSNGWTASEDSARFYYQVVPEPITMLGVCLGIGGLTNYMRKRKGLSLA